MNIKLGIVLAGLVSAAIPAAEAAVIVEQQSPDIQAHRTLTYEGVRMREELDVPAGRYVALVLPDENRILELSSHNRTYSEKPLGSEMGELRAMQQSMAEDAELLDEQVNLEKLDAMRIAGMDCQNYRIEWNAQVQTKQGRKKYSIQDEMCVSKSSTANAARNAVRRHIQAIAERFGEVIDFDSGKLSIFDMGKMFFGVPAKKFNQVKSELGGFALRENVEVDFGGALLEPMMRAVAKEKGTDEAEVNEMMSDMQRAMKMMQDPRFQAQMKESMKQAKEQMNDPAVQAQMQQFLPPEQQQKMRQGLENMQRGGVGLTAGSGSSLKFTRMVTRIEVVPDMPQRTEVPQGYTFAVKGMQAEESREPDQKDGAGALSKADIQRIIKEIQTGRRPSQTSPDYPTVSKNVEPWMIFYREWEGVPYRWGGNTKSGIDCSGLTKNAYATVVPLNIPRTTAEQMNIGPRITLNHIRAGDLIFFDTEFRHVGVYLAQNKFFHASSSKGVTISTLGNSYWSKAYRFAVRPAVR